jgi:hypothetical protein
MSESRWRAVQGRYTAGLSRERPTAICWTQMGMAESMKLSPDQASRSVVPIVSAMACADDRARRFLPGRDPVLALPLETRGGPRIDNAAVPAACDGGTRLIPGNEARPSHLPRASVVRGCWRAGGVSGWSCRSSSIRCCRQAHSIVPGRVSGGPKPKPR